jgi:hypothetical protein
MMKKLARLSVAVAALASAGLVANAVGQEKTREQVRQELIDAQQHGMQYVTDTSYPDVARIYQQQAAQDPQDPQKDTSGVGPDMQGAHESGARVPAVDGNAAKPACVGPVSYCSIYFGS